MTTTTRITTDACAQCQHAELLHLVGVCAGCFKATGEIDDHEFEPQLQAFDLEMEPLLMEGDSQ